MVGLVALPVVFVWLLLRPGFARSTRLAAFSYALAPPLLVLLLSVVGQVTG